jgi:adenosylcobyric acid synthase
VFARSAAAAGHDARLVIARAPGGRLAPCLMIQGTASGVGKSLLTTALCRLFARAGHRVAPFKSQNMALNAAVSADGGEIGRAQAAQAEAAGVEPTVDMNPILLKPEGDLRAQLVVRGAAAVTVDFPTYQTMTATLVGLVGDSLARLRAAHDLVLIEGAGSPAEINLAATEIVNMRIARLADAPVLLVGDIDRGGVFASLVGTLALLEPEDRARVGGFLINRFRGDRRLLEPGLEMLTARTGVPVLGVVSMIPERLVPAEDSLDLERIAGAAGDAVLDVAVVRLPRIANFDDFEPLAGEPGVRVRFVRTAAELAGADLVVLPGTKTTVADLTWLQASGVGAAVRAAAAVGRSVLGVCGGFQMLGERVDDPEGMEGLPGSAEGLGLLPVTTVFAGTKRTVRVRARVVATRGLLAEIVGHEIAAYEIHVGSTRCVGEAAFAITSRGAGPVDEADGAVSADGAVIGTYLHGLFADDRLRGAVLRAVAARAGRVPDPRWGRRRRAGERYDRLADIVGEAVDMTAVAKLVGLSWPHA